MGCMRDMPRYFEFAVASNFSFLRGASHAEELMLQAAHIGLDGLGPVSYTHLTLPTN